MDTTLLVVIGIAIGVAINAFRGRRDAYRRGYEDGAHDYHEGKRQ